MLSIVPTPNISSTYYPPVPVVSSAPIALLTSHFIEYINKTRCRDKFVVCRRGHYPCMCTTGKYDIPASNTFLQDVDFNPHNDLQARTPITLMISPH